MQIIASNRIKKGGYLAAFFSLLLSSILACQPVSAKDAHREQKRPLASNEVEALVDKALQNNLAQDPRWAALLHYNEDGFQIRSKDFLLSLSNASLQAELSATLRFLYLGDAANVCRFPARYLWLREQLQAPELSIDACSDFQEFILRAPADQVSLVFASENISQPSSMMGHVFLKLNGIDARGEFREHAISFFTDAAGFNAPKLFYDSMVVGKRGFFALSPYQEKIVQYLGEEQRNVWEYPLRLDPTQRYLLQAHLIELKQTELTYFFQKYNCATVVDFILAVGAGRTSPNAGFWLTPKDVVKRAQAANLVAESIVRPPNRWLVRAFSESLKASDISAIKTAVEQLQVPDASVQDQQSQARLSSLALAYLSYREEQKLVEPTEAAQYRKRLRERAAAPISSVNFALEERRNPLNMPQDSQWDLGLVRRLHENFARYTLTPASHHLEDDNRSYANESELVLFELSILQSLQRRRFLIDQFTIYSAKSLMPHDPMTGGVSGSVKFGLSPQFGRNFESKQTWHAGAGIGLSHRWMQDIDLTMQVESGVSNRLGTFQVYLQPQLTMLVRSVFDMKTILSVSQLSTLDRDHYSVRSLRWQQAKYFENQTWSLHASIQRDWMGRVARNQFELRLRHLF